MARKFLTPIDLSGLELLNALAQNLPAPPAHAPGRFYYDTTRDQLGVSDGDSWAYLGEEALDEAGVRQVVAAMFAGTETGINIAISGDGETFEVTVDDATAELRGLVELATTAETLAGTDTERAVTPAGVRAVADTLAPIEHSHGAGDLPTATTTASGVVELATVSETTAGTDAERAVTPAGVKAVADGKVNTDDARLTDQRTPTDGSVTNAKVATNAAISADKLADGTTGKVFTATERTKLTGIATGATANATDNALRDRSTHHGTQSAATISDFDAQVRTNRLDQLASPTGPVALNNQRLTNLAAPTADADAATKAYVDATVQGLDIKGSVRWATTGNIALTGTPAIDGGIASAGERVLVKNQTNAAENGIYVVATGAWTRAADFDSSADVTSGAFVFVEEGDTNGDTGWALTTNGTIVPGTTPQTWSQFSGAGAVVAGDGLTRVGNILNVTPGTGLVVAADSVSIDTNVVSRKVAATVGNGVATAFTITHNLGRDVVVQVVSTTAPYDTVEVDVERPLLNDVIVRFGAAPAANAYRVLIQG